MKQVGRDDYRTMRKAEQREQGKNRVRTEVKVTTSGGSEMR
jgi:hypothetical protein